MNLGGPSTIQEVHPFLSRLFSDKDLIPLPFQRYLGPWIARRRTPKVQGYYSKIGGGSPIKKWTTEQGDLLISHLNSELPSTAPHKFYIAFRYADPLTEEAVIQMKTDGITDAVAFTQYPQYSCSTTGSSLNELYRVLQMHDPNRSINWKVIDRWPTHFGFTKTTADLISRKLKEFEKPEDVLILFSAHSLPMSVVNRGDCYPKEVAASVDGVMKHLDHANPYRLVWQSRVGPLPWLGPETKEAIDGLKSNGVKDILLVPIAFTSDHIETLYELDLLYIKESNANGMNIKRTEALNVEPGFIQTLGSLVKKALSTNSVSHSRQFHIRCSQCTNPVCGSMRKYFA